LYEKPKTAPSAWASEARGGQLDLQEVRLERLIKVCEKPTYQQPKAQIAPELKAPPPTRN